MNIHVQNSQLGCPGLYMYLLNKLFGHENVSFVSLFNFLSWLLYTKPESRISVLHYIAGIFPQLVPVHICAYMYNLLCYSLFGRRDVRSRGCLLEMPPATPRSWLLALNVFWCLSPAERLMIPLLHTGFFFFFSDWNGIVDL